MQRVGIWVPSELLVAREAVQVYGPDENGQVDLSAGEPGGRVIPVPMRDGEDHLPGHSCNGPADIGTRGAEGLALLILSRELPTGLHEFAVRPFDRQTGEAASDPANTYEIFLNTAPRAVRAVRPVEELVGGRLRFRFGKQVES